MEDEWRIKEICIWDRVFVATKANVTQSSQKLIFQNFSTSTIHKMFCLFRCFCNFYCYYYLYLTIETNDNYGRYIDNDETRIRFCKYKLYL